MEWKLADAKNRFSEVFSRAIAEGPQRIMRRSDTVVVVSEQEFNRLRGVTPSFKEFLRHGPDMSDLDLERSKSLSREIEF
jgi:prevent-host-death family protein